MMGSTKPVNFKRFGVIRMMTLRNFIATNFAWEFLNITFFKINMKIRASVHFLACQSFEWVSFSPFSHIFGVARKTIMFTLGAWLSAWTCSDRHKYILCGNS